MTEVSGDVCRGPGLVAYPLLACRAATLVFQVLACWPPTESRSRPLLLACLALDWRACKTPWQLRLHCIDHRVLALHVTLDAALAHPVLILARIPPEDALLRLHPHASPSMSAVDSENDAVLTWRFPAAERPQMLAAALTLTFIWVRETGNRNQFLRQLRFSILPNSEAG